VPFLGAEAFSNMLRTNRSLWIFSIQVLFVLPLLFSKENPDGIEFCMGYIFVILGIALCILNW
jgi:hypothetical protein